MKRIIDKVEKHLIRIIVLSLLVIVVVQGMMTHDPLRLYLSWSERMEGQVVEYPVAGDAKTVNKDEPEKLNVISPEAHLILGIEEFSSLPRSIVLVNGREKVRFNDKEVKLLLKAADVVEVDSRAYNFPVTYYIKNSSDNLAFPEKETLYTANQSIVMIGKVIVK
ncbi:MAG TPA: hypothetical protein DD791_06645 [Syntrophomonas sp.]|nr:hypothetical protein [Syntrophomonas sp.]